MPADLRSVGRNGRMRPFLGPHMRRPEQPVATR